MKNGVQRLIDVLAAMLLLVASSLVLFRFSVPLGLLFSALTLLYVVFCLARRTEKRPRLHRYAAGDMASVLVNVLKSIDDPVLIVGSGNKIVWANRRFESLPQVSSHMLLSTTEKLFDDRFCFAQLEDACEEGKDVFEFETGGETYRVHILAIATKNKTYYATVWTNVTNEAKLSGMLIDDAPMLALIAVDNASELSQSAAETFRLAAAKISLTLTEWAKRMQAVLLEYEDGKFLLLFRHDRLQEMIDSKFAIIDEISALTSESSMLPLTISIGVSDETGTLAEKQESAQTALRTALQRGGAIAVVKDKERSGYIAFGGKVKSAQRQTSIRSRVCRDLLMEQIRVSSNVLVMGHLRPDYDSIASNIGVAKLVSFLGKPVQIVTDREESIIAGAFEMLSPFPEYETMFVDARRAMDLMTPDTLLVITDASNPNQFFSADLYQTAPRVIVIDHHTLASHLGDNVLTPMNIDPNASSASELVCEILELAIPDGLLRTEEAQLLLLGILLDTQFFTRDTGSRTFHACSYLRSAGADPAKAKMKFKTTPEEYEMMEGFERRRYRFRDRFIISYCEEPDARNVVLASKCAERFVGIEGICASFVLYMRGDGVSLSARSDGTYNVLPVVESLGGGGHFQSAGARLMRLVWDEEKQEKINVPVLDMDLAREMLEQTIDKCIQAQ